MLYTSLGLYLNRYHRKSSKFKGRHRYSRGSPRRFFHVACGILVPWPGIRPASPPLEASSHNHWTTRDIPRRKRDFNKEKEESHLGCLQSFLLQKHYRVERELRWGIGKLDFSPTFVTSCVTSSKLLYFSGVFISSAANEKVGLNGLWGPWWFKNSM